MSDPIPPIEDSKPNQSIIGQVSKAVTEPLVGPLEKLIGEGRIRDTDRPRMFVALVLVLLAPFVILGSPENTNVRLFIVIVFALLIPVMWGGLIREWRGRPPKSDSNEILRLFIIVYVGSKARGIKDATVRVSGAKSFIGTTDDSGQCIFEYPSHLRDQNQKIHILAEKSDLGESDTVEVQLVGQTVPIYLELLPRRKGGSEKDIPIDPEPNIGQENLTEPRELKNQQDQPEEIPHSSKYLIYNPQNNAIGDGSILFNSSSDNRLSETTFRKIIQQFEGSDQQIIANVVARLDEQTLGIVQKILQSMEMDKPEYIKPKDIIIELESVLVSVGREKVILEDPAIANETIRLSRIINGSHLSESYRLKLSIPIVPVLLLYKSEIDSDTGIKLQQLWEKLTQWSMQK